MDTLFYGDNFDVMHRQIADESVDLVYLDPPFNSKATYNILFRSPAGEQSVAQAEAFRDTWTWGEEAQSAYDEVLKWSSEAGNILRALRGFMHESDAMAYLAMMTLRLGEIRRVLKPTGSVFLHCDPTASHYLKIIMDGIFGVRNFRNEIIWDYTFRLMDLPRFFNRKHDVILFYAKSKASYFRMPKSQWTREALLASRKQKVHVDADGVEWIWMPGGRGNSKNKLRRIDDIIAVGKATADVWPIPIVSSSAKERVGYPTQKPRPLLERIISAACPEEGIVLDPFCGCGTSIHAAEALGRQWIGIDVAHYAILTIEERLKVFCPDAKYQVVGRPRDMASARDMARRDKFQFQWWATSLLGVRTWQNQTSAPRGPDRGVDGYLFFKNGPYGEGVIVISVKGGDAVTAGMIDELIGTVDRMGANMGVFLCLAQPTKEMTRRASAAGAAKTAHGVMPRIQIRTIEDLIVHDHFPELPPTFNFDSVQELRRARGPAKALAAEEKQLSFLFPLSGGRKTARTETKATDLFDRSAI